MIYFKLKLFLLVKKFLMLRTLKYAEIIPPRKKCTFFLCIKIHKGKEEKLKTVSTNNIFDIELTYPVLGENVLQSKFSKMETSKL